MFTIRLATIIILFGISACKTGAIVNEKPAESILIRSDYKIGEVTQLCAQAMQYANGQFDLIAKLSPEQRTIQNTLLAFEKTNAELTDAATPLTFMGSVSTNPSINKEGSACEDQLNQFEVSVFTRKDLYEAIQAQVALTPTHLQLQSETLKSFEDNGLKLPVDELKKVKELKQSLASMESQFSTNLNEDQSTVEFTEAELEGVPHDFINGLKKTTDGKFVVTTKEPDYVRIMDNSSHSETRRKMQDAYENRAAIANTKLLEDAIQLRQKIAAVMGYKSWADYRLHHRMAKDSETVLTFLNGLKQKLSLRNKDDLTLLLKFKKETDPTATELKAWDLRYYANQLKKRDYHLDKEVIREYFPLDRVMNGLFQVYSKLLSVHYIEEKGTQVWADGVKLYQIRNTADNELIGYFYIDFIPRAGKYGHAAAFPLISARFIDSGPRGKPGGQYSHPISAIVANLSAAENGKPVLLTHDEVETIFHEFGHIMHQTLTRAPFASLSGSNVDQDFVEAPSQMLENWVYSPEILTLLSGHYLDPSKKLPSELLQKIVAARDFNQGYFYTRQLVLALTDMTYHTTLGPVNSTQIYHDLHKELTGIDAIANSHFQASFGHLMGGYDAGYYGYLWSEVYAADLFTRFQKEGLQSPEVGLEYRKTILEKGKMIDAFELLREFLGREPNSEAFYRKLHLETSPGSR